jgi:hypothetical protein
MDTPDRFAGRLVQTYSYTVPADPGWAQPDRHRETSPEPNARDHAPKGGGWQPAAWGESGVNVLPGTAATFVNNHHGTMSHHGDMGRGAAGPSVQLGNLDELRAPGDSPAPLLGAAGAANGGLRAEGSAPWMSPGASRRRADGGMVFRMPGFRLGHKHTPVTAEHRQGLHMNRPKIRGVRQKIITTGYDPNGRPAGPVQPKNHPQLGGYTYDDVPPAGPTNAGPIGGGWAL